MQLTAISRLGGGVELAIAGKRSARLGGGVELATAGKRSARLGGGCRARARRHPGPPERADQ